MFPMANAPAWAGTRVGTLTPDDGMRHSRGRYGKYSLVDRIPRGPQVHTRGEDVRRERL